MIDFITGCIFSFVLVVFFFKLLSLNRQKPSPFTTYFLGGIGISAVGQVIATVLVGIVLIIGNTSNLLYWTDIIGRFALLGGAAFTVQIPLYMLFPKSRNRFLVSYAVILATIILLIANLTQHYKPFFNPIGITEIPNTLVGTISGILLLVIWLSATIVFFFNFIQSKFKSTRSLLLGCGFLLTSLGGSSYQAFDKNVTEYLIANLVITLGFLILFAALFVKE
jgi:hydrogenase/urease accessory protein HupE